MSMIKRLLMTSTLAVAFAFLPRIAAAVQVEDLYQAHVPVADQSSSERTRAVREGLAQVLIKVTGRANAVVNPAVEQALNRADSYLSKFGYQHEDAVGNAPEQRLLVATFSQSSVDRLVRRSGLPIWPANRPELLVWMVVDVPAEGRLHVSREQMPEAHRFLAQAMAARGAPLVSPLLDLEDQLTLSARAAWKLSEEQLLAAARRYNVNHWLVLRFYQTQSGAYRGSAQVTSGADSGLAVGHLTNLDASTMEELIKRGVDTAVDRLAVKYAFVPRVDLQTVALQLENVTDYNTYKAVFKRFEQMEMIRNVQVAGANGAILDVRLEIDGSREVLLDMLRRDQQFSEVVDFSSENPELRFQWRGPE